MHNPRNIIRIFTLVGLSMFVPACAGGSSGGSPSSSGDPVSTQVYQAVNAYRIRNGKNGLSRHKGLDRLAMDHSRFLLKNSGNFGLYGTKVSHEGFDGRVLAARRMYGMDSVSENVAAANVGDSVAGESLLAMWKRSKGHHSNLLQDWTYTGIGSARGSDGTVYSTQIFATKTIGLTPLRDRMNQAF